MRFGVGTVCIDIFIKSFLFSFCMSLDEFDRGLQVLLASARENHVPPSQISVALGMASAVYDNGFDSPLTSRVVGPYESMPEFRTYALGVQALRDSYAAGECPSQPTVVIDNKQWVRPLTLKENLQARVDDYETRHDAEGKERTVDDRLRFFNQELDSCTGIAYEKGTTRFKITPACRELIMIDSLFDERFISVSYDDVHGDNVVTLDRHDGIYDKELTREQVIKHPAWRAVVGDDEDGRKLLQVYSRIVFDHIPEDGGMGFYVRQRQEHDKLQALFVSFCYSDSSGSCGSDDHGIHSLDNFSFFLRVSR